MKGKPGFRIRFDIERPPQELLAKLSGMSTPNISDAMARTGAMDHRIKPLNKDYRIMGPAVTVKVNPGTILCCTRPSMCPDGRYPGRRHVWLLYQRGLWRADVPGCYREGLGRPCC